MNTSIIEQSLPEEAKEINKQLMWYMKSFDNGVDVSTITFDPAAYLYKISDALNNPLVDIFACEREKNCRCKYKSTCRCDSDIIHEIYKSSMDFGSNCRFICDLHFKEKDIKFSRKKLIRIFSLDKKTDEEVPIMDIDKEAIRFISDQKVGFNVTEKIIIKHSHIIVKFDYMSFDLN